MGSTIGSRLIARFAARCSTTGAGAGSTTGVATGAGSAAAGQLSREHEHVGGAGGTARRHRLVRDTSETSGGKVCGADVRLDTCASRPPSLPCRRRRARKMCRPDTPASPPSASPPSASPPSASRPMPHRPLPHQRLEEASPASRTEPLAHRGRRHALGRPAWMPPSAAAPPQGAELRELVRAYPLCCPSRASFLTGRTPTTTASTATSTPFGFAAFKDRRTLATGCRAATSTALVGKYLNGYGEQPVPTGATSVADLCPAGLDPVARGVGHVWGSGDPVRRRHLRLLRPGPERERRVVVLAGALLHRRPRRADPLAGQRFGGDRTRGSSGGLRWPRTTVPPSSRTTRGRRDAPTGFRHLGDPGTARLGQGQVRPRSPRLGHAADGSAEADSPTSRATSASCPS